MGCSSRAFVTGIREGTPRKRIRPRCVLIETIVEPRSSSRPDQRCAARGPKLQSFINMDRYNIATSSAQENELARSLDVVHVIDNNLPSDSRQDVNKLNGTFIQPHPNKFKKFQQLGGNGWYYNCCELSNLCSCPPRYDGKFYCLACNEETTSLAQRLFKYQCSMCSCMHIQFKTSSTRRIIGVFKLYRVQLSEETVKRANLSSRERERMKLPNDDNIGGTKDMFHIREFLNHPSGIESILNTSALQNYYSIDSNTYSLRVEKLWNGKLNISQHP
ncbi:hypothetical protein POM88_039372 [Heracleum sosnowskyi]|uniref:Uncharacterized protein n=1 Tax=Heracleum sosnowskyi TaxID=360622 RepID=A0AAD8M7S3_9APIA|nr:hypothetical protein POM88_039372 [Heracleum sosnowskyi]